MYVDASLCDFLLVQGLMLDISALKEASMTSPWSEAEFIALDFEENPSAKRAKAEAEVTMSHALCMSLRDSEQAKLDHTMAHTAVSDSSHDSVCLHLFLKPLSNLSLMLPYSAFQASPRDRRLCGVHQSNRR